MKRLFLIFAFLGTLTIALGEDDEPSDGTEVPFPENTDTPLDESAGMFAGAIVAMGAYILYRKRKNVKAEK